MYRVGRFACVAALAAAVASAALTAPAPSIAPGRGRRGRVPATSAAKATAAKAGPPAPRIVVTPGAIRLPGQPRRAPLTTAQCERNRRPSPATRPTRSGPRTSCPRCTPEGITGKGETIVIVDSFGSPDDQARPGHLRPAVRLPRAAQVHDHHAGRAGPRVQPEQRQTWSSWAGETTLDVEYAHALAPGASILLVETPASENEGTSGFPQIVTAEEYVIDHQLGAVISQSFSATEETFASYAQIEPLRAAYLDADSHHVTVLAASGDAGATDYTADGSDLLHPPGDVLAGQRPAGDRRSAALS